jgi:hypothetical protein
MSIQFGFKTGCDSQEWVQELTLLQTRGSELCQAIVDPPRVRSHVSEGMKIAALYNTKMVEQLAALQAAVSSATQFVLECSPTMALQVDVLDELVTEFRKQEERRSCIKQSGMMVCNLILGSPTSRVWLAKRLDETIGQLGVEQAARWDADTKLEAFAELCRPGLRVGDRKGPWDVFLGDVTVLGGRASRGLF